MEPLCTLSGELAPNDDATRTSREPVEPRPDLAKDAVWVSWPTLAPLQCHVMVEVRFGLLAPRREEKCTTPVLPSKPAVATR